MVHVLRAFPGVSELESKFAGAALWPQELERLKGVADLLTERLFGLNVASTLYPGNDGFRCMSDSEWDAWDMHFYALEYEYEDAKPLWDALNWDVSDGNGNELKCMALIGRQVLCVAKGLKGQIPDIESVEAEVQAGAWGDRLEADVRRFRRKKSRAA